MRKRTISPSNGVAYLVRTREKEAEIAFFVTMQEPVSGVGARIELLDEAKIAVDAHQKHGAVDAVALDVGS